MGSVVEDADDETFTPTCISESTGPPPTRRINTDTRALDVPKLLLEFSVTHDKDILMEELKQVYLGIAKLLVKRCTP
jgi:hypothetical protein